MEIVNVDLWAINPFNFTWVIKSRLFKMILLKLWVTIPQLFELVLLNLIWVIKSRLIQNGFIKIWSFLNPNMLKQCMIKFR